MASELPSVKDEARVAAAASNTQLLERTVLLLLFGGLLVGVLAVLLPFTTAILFGAILAIAGWPLRDFLLRCGLKRGLAATLLLLLALALIALPMIAVAPGLAEQLTQGRIACRTTSPALRKPLPGSPGCRSSARASLGYGTRRCTPRGASGPFSNHTPTHCGNCSSGRPGRSPRVCCRSSCRWS